MARSDKYANMASAEVEVSAGAIVFTELNLGVSLGSKVGVVIDQLDYYPSSGLFDDMQTDGDYIYYGWSTSNSLTTVEINQKGVIHTAVKKYLGIGTPAVGLYLNQPETHQFFPPIIIAAPKIYLFLSSSGVASGKVRARMYYRYVDLTSQEYLELAESFILVG